MADASTKTIPKASDGSRKRFGPIYKLKGDQNQYALPSRLALKPGLEGQPGELDSWPVHGVAAVTSSLSLGQVHRPRSINRDKAIEPSGAELPASIIPKPRFLSQLESYLEKELKILECPPQGPNPLRLQVHREVFEYLMEDFKTYKPLMSAIKNEYDLIVRWQEEEIERLEPLQTALKTVEEECERRIMSVRGEEKADVSNLKQENKKLCKIIDSFNDEKASLQAQVDKLTEELSTAYRQYRDEADARKLLITEINELRFQQQDSGKGHGNDDEDPVLLKMMLNRAREDLKRCQQRLNGVLADYQDVVPRQEFEQLEEKANALAEESEKTSNDFKALMQEHSTLLAVHKELLTQRDKFAHENELLKRSSTPRPEWDRCADFVEGGAEKWQELTDGRTSDEIVDILVAELTGNSLEDVRQTEHFEGQGTGDEVPKYLKFEGQVRNRHLGKKETLQLIDEVWEARSQQKQENVDSFGDFVYAYLQQRFVEPSLVAEWGYNLHDACARLANRDERIDMFEQILGNEVLEDVYHRQKRKQDSLLEALKKTDEGNKGTVSKDELTSALSSVYVAKSQASVAALVQTAEEMAASKESDIIDYQELLTETASSSSPFLDALRSQDKAEKSELVADVMQALEGKSEVTAEQFMGVIRSVDPAKSEADSKMIIAYVFSVAAVDDVASVQATLDVATISAQLQSGVFERSASRHGRSIE